MNAKKIFNFKPRQGELIVEMVIWQLPTKTSERPHRLKFRLFCGKPGHCLVRYDNETGKGDHIHYGKEEVNYDFHSVDQLIEDFRADCEKLSDWRWK